MLDLRRLRLLRELHERGTIAAVADALQFTPSAVSQQLAVLEREAGVTLLERAGRGVRLTDAALVLVGHAAGAARAGRAGRGRAGRGRRHVAGRARIASFQSVALQLAIPAMARWRATRPDLRCELIEAEPEQSLPRSRSATSTSCWATSGCTCRIRGRRRDREDLHRDPVYLRAAGRPSGRAAPRARGAAGRAGRRAVDDRHPGTGWEEMTVRTCREFGGFDPDIRHRSNDSVIGLDARRRRPGGHAASGARGPGHHPGVAVRADRRGPVHRTIFAATRSRRRRAAVGARAAGGDPRGGRRAWLGALALGQRALHVGGHAWWRTARRHAARRGPAAGSARPCPGSS